MSDLSKRQIRKMAAAVYNAKRSAEKGLPMTPPEARLVLRSVEGCATLPGTLAVIRKLRDEANDKTAQTIYDAAVLVWPNKTDNVELQTAITHESEARDRVIAETKERTNKAKKFMYMAAAHATQVAESAFKTAYSEMSQHRPKWSK